MWAAPPVELEGLGRRGFLRAAGMFSVLVPIAGFVPSLSRLEGIPKTSGTAFPSEDPWPPTPAYNFALIADRANSPLLMPARSGANDASSFLGNTFTWSGSASGDVQEMVAAFEDALDNKVDGIACAFVHATAFNALTDQALAAGIPVVAFHEPVVAGSGNNALAYIGQDYHGAGVALAEEALSYLGRGDTVAAIVRRNPTPGEQLRLAGASAVMRSAGARVEMVLVEEDAQHAEGEVVSWWRGHQGARLFFGTGAVTSHALAGAAKASGMAARGVRAIGFDVPTPVLEAISAGHMQFTMDQQAYLQGFLPVLELFLYNITGGLLRPVDVETGHHIVTKDNVGRYLMHSDSWEGTSTRPVVITPPTRINP